MYGMEYILGVWIDGIMLNMGIGFVVNGYEVIVGQINVEFYKLEEGECFYFNLFVNVMQCFEGNFSLCYLLSKNVYIGLFFYGKY